MRIFDMTMLVRTVNGESLSEIAIHNFEKSRKIEIRIVPYGIFRYGHLGRRKWSRWYILLYTQGLVVAPWPPKHVFGGTPVST